MRLPRGDEPRPARPGPPAMDHAHATRSERLRDELRGTPVRMPKVVNDNQRYTVRLFDRPPISIVLGFWDSHWGGLCVLFANGCGCPVMAARAVATSWMWA